MVSWGAKQSVMVTLVNFGLISGHRYSPKFYKSGPNNLKFSQKVYLYQLHQLCENCDL